MTRISSYTAFQSGIMGIMDGQNKMNNAQAQASSEKVATSLKGYGIDAKKLVNARSMVNRYEARNEDLKNLQARATVEATAFTSFTDSIQSVRSAFNTAISSNSGAGFKAALDGALEDAIAAANVEFSGQAIFGGVNAYNEPMVFATLDALAAQPNTDPNFKDTGVNRLVTLDDGRTVELSKSAEQVFKPFVDFLRNVRAYENANGAFTGKLTDAQNNWLKSQLPALETIQTNALANEADAGILAKEIETTIARNDERILHLDGIVGDIQNVDLAEVAAKLSAAQTQYQASAAIFAQLKDLNLLQYLR